MLTDLETKLVYDDVYRRDFNAGVEHFDNNKPQSACKKNEGQHDGWRYARSLPVK